MSCSLSNTQKIRKSLAFNILNVLQSDIYPYIHPSEMRQHYE